jgi:hypothetical protein
VLNGAAAAGAEIPAERLDPLHAGSFHMDQRSTVRMTGDFAGLDDLTTERIWYEHASASGQGNAVAALADVIDDKALSHVSRR